MLRLVFNAASTAVNKYNDVLSTMMELGSGEAFNRDDILQKTLATNKLSESTYKYMLAIGVTSTAEMTFGQKVKLSTMALWDQAKAWAMTPFGMATIAAAAIFAIVKAIDYFSSASERAAEELAKLEEEYDELQGKILDTASEFKNLRTSAESVIPRFVELAKGVNALGKNVSLTDEEYNEFLSLNNQIAEMFPELNLGMDSNGNAMLSLSYTADTLAESLWNVVEAERAAANQEIADSMPDVLENIEGQVNIYRDKIAELSETQSDYFDTYSNFLNRSLPTNIGNFSTLESGLAAAEEFIKIAKELGIHGSVMYDNNTGTNNGYAFSVEWDYTALDHRFLLEEVEKQFDIAMQKYDKLINDYRSRIDAVWNTLNPVVGSWLQTDFMFQDLDSTMQEIVSVMVNGLDFGSLGLKTKDEVTKYVQENIIEPLFLATPEVKDAFEKITDWQELLKNGEITFEQFSDYVTNAFSGLFDQMDPTAIEMFKSIFVSAFNQIGIAGEDFETVLANLINEWGRIPDAANEASGAINVFVESSEKLSTAKKNIDSLSDAMSKLADGSLDVWEVVELVKKFPELAEYVDLTADGFGRLDEGLRKLARQEVEKFIDEMQQFKETRDLTEEQKKQIDGLCDSLSNLATDSVQNLSGEFGILADQINAATKAQTELEKKLAEDDYDEGYEGRVSAYEGLQETIKAGEFGSKAYAAYKNYFGLEDMDSSGVKKWMEDNKKYFTEGTDGVLEFMKTVERLGEADASFKEVATFDSSTGAFWYDINRLSEFAKELDWTEQMVQDFIYKYRMYCEEWESRSAQDNLTEFTKKGFIFSIGNDTFASIEKLMDYTGLTRDEVKGLISDINNLNNADILTELEELGAGGGVDLTLRPAIDTSELANKGWDVAAGEIATVFTNTFTNEAGDVAVNFTPIIVDENGNYIGTLSEDELISYAEGVIAGTREDDLKLQIGSEFVGENAIQQAEDAANRIHDLHESLQSREGIQLIGEDQISITQATITQWQNLGATAEEVSALLIDLKKQDVAIAPNLYIDTESGPQIDVDKMLAEAGFDDAQTVQMEVDLVVNNEPAMATVEFTVGEVQRILGDDWEAKLTANSVDAETGISAVDQLLAELPPSTDVLLLDNTGLARSSLSTVINLLDTVEDNKTKTVTIRYRTIGIPMFADGTRRAQRGPALLGDEYSPDGSPKPELVVSGNTAYIAGADGPEIGFLNDGDVVYTADQTRRILQGNVLHRNIPAHAGGTTPDWAGLSSGAYSGSNTGSGKGSSSSSSSSGDDEESWFERQYKDHQHWLAMDQESVDEYLKWLDEAYQKAYEEGIIDLDEYYKYQEEVYQGVQDQFKDHINDIDHEISLLEAGVGNSDEIINLSLQAMADIEAELAAARAAGLDENSDYIQWLEQQWMNYSENVTNMREQAETEAQSSIDNLVEYRIEMLKQEIQDQKDALSEQLDDLQDFYDKQRKMLQDQYDEEKYLEEQAEKRKSVSDIRTELAMLERDDSAWAQKRKLELQEQLAEAEKDLNNFERDHALDKTLDMLDEQQAAQEALLQAEIDALDEKLNDPHTLFNQALADIKNNTEELYNAFIEYNRKHGTGNDEDIADMWKEAYKADLDYQETHNGEHLDGVAIGNYTGYIAPETTAPAQPDPPSESVQALPHGKASDVSGDIGVGSSGEQVRAIQYALNALGFGNSGTQGCDGQFGNGTQTAVRAFQSAMGITPDGIVGANTKAKFRSMGYSMGTRSASTGIHRVDELGPEFVFESSDGNRYRVFRGGEKVLNANATNFLYDFANHGRDILSAIIRSLAGGSIAGKINGVAQVFDINMGDIIVQGNADSRTVSQIRREQRQSVDYMLKEIGRLKK